MEQGGSPLRWEPELGTRIGVMPRDGTSADVVWFTVDPCYVFHPLNAYTDAGRVVADVCRYRRLPLFGDGEGQEGMEDLSARLTRWTLDLASGTAKEEPLDDAASEFPRLDERFAGLRYRHGFAGGRLPGAEDGAGFNAILHWDLARGTRRAHALPVGDVTGEPLFVPLRAGAGEGEGVLLALVYRGAERRSDLLVLDAANVEGAPLATVKLPHRVPFGFHGNWAPGV
jgi:carotenoid cleavage dioxygenase